MDRLERHDKISEYFPKPNLEEVKFKVKLDLSNHETKADFKKCNRS